MHTLIIKNDLKGKPLEAEENLGKRWTFPLNNIRVVRPTVRATMQWLSIFKF